MTTVEEVFRIWHTQKYPDVKLGRFPQEDILLLVAFRAGWNARKNEDFRTAYTKPIILGNDTLDVISRSMQDQSDPVGLDEAME